MEQNTGYLAVSILYNSFVSNTET